MKRAFLVALLSACGGSQDVQLAPPAQGFQLGTPAFDVAKGTEDQRCYFFTVKGTQDVDHIVAALNAGSHHMNVFRVKTVHDLDGNDGDVVVGGPCWVSSNWSDWPLVINSQEGGDAVDWQLPAGVVQHFDAGEKLMLQVHYVNAQTQSTPGRGKALVNFVQASGTGPFQELGTVFATDQQIKVCPGETNKLFAATCRFARQPVTIVAANGHFHSRGVKFTIAPSDDANQPGATFYTSTEWSDPPMARGLNIPIMTNGGIYYTCSYTLPADQCGDPNNQCCVTFGPHVETQEHCNAFVYYYPKQTDASCF